MKKKNGGGGSKMVLWDMYAEGFEEPIMDPIDSRHDKELVMATQDGDMTSFIFTMPASNCHDPHHDSIILPDRHTFVMWAIGDGDDDGSMSIGYHGNNKGKRSLPLLMEHEEWKALQQPLVLPPNTNTFTIQLPEMEVPAQDTIYYCIMVEAPHEEKYHIYETKLLHYPEVK